MAHDTGFIASSSFCSVLLSIKTHWFFDFSLSSTAPDVSESWCCWGHCLGRGSGCVKYAWSCQAGAVAAPAGTACGPSEQWGALPTPHLPRLSGLLQGLHLECQQVKVSCLAESGGRGQKSFVFAEGQRFLSFVWNITGWDWVLPGLLLTHTSCIHFPSHSFTREGNLIGLLCLPC